jgi:predicted dehydrogenase
MKSNRRDFIKLTGLAGAGIAGASIIPSIAIAESGPGKPKLDNIRIEALKKHPQHFNMNGFAAPKLDKVRIGFIGTGSRGTSHVLGLTHIEGVEIKALCDIVDEHAQNAKKRIAPAGFHPDVYSGKVDSWKKVCERPDIDVIYIATPWELHTPIATYAMEHGKHVCVEVPAAMTIEDCWKLVETSERTKKHCMMLENCCYDFFELLTLNMARQGFFGEIIHGEGAYLHYRTDKIFNKTGTTWRLKDNMNRNGNLYPTHGLGPVCQIMNINRGDRLDYMVSTSGKDFSYGPTADKLAETDDFWKPFAHKNYRGNMNVSTIRTVLGRTIMLQHDTSSPRVYSRIHLISGTKASALKYPLPGRISLGEDWLSEHDYSELEKKYTPYVIKKMGEVAKEMGGHGGMDTLMNWRLIDCLRNGLPLDMNVYDAATYSCIEPLSEWSVANRSNSIDIPDFTNGAWKTNAVVLDIDLKTGGGTTAINVNNGVKA